MAEAYTGEIRVVGFNYAPRGWAFCHGQLLSINDYQMLYSLLGTTYGGDGHTTFALPDLRGRASVGVGSASGIPEVFLGQRIGTDFVSLRVDNLPQHSHSIMPATGQNSFKVHNSMGDQNNVDGNTKSLAISGASGRTPVLAENSFSTNSPDAIVPDAITTPTVTNYTGQGKAFHTIQPSIGLNHIICLEDIYPARN